MTETQSTQDPINQIRLKGNLAEDAKVSPTKAGGQLIRLTLATDDGFKNEEGNWQSRSHFHQIKLWNKTPDETTHLQKGAKVRVIGKLVSGEKSEDEQGKIYYNTYVKANKVIHFANEGGE